MLTHYLGQVEHPQLAFSVKQRRPKTVDEAVRATLEMESYLAPRDRAAQVTEGSIPPEPVAAVREQQDAMMTLLQQVVQRMDMLESCLAALQGGLCSTQPPVAGPGANRSSTNKERGPVICHRCKKVGHLARGCVAPWQQQGHPTSPGNERPSV